MKNKSFAVIGLGQFGMTLAVTLAESDCDVLAIDDKEENIEEISEKVTYAVKADVREPGILKALGVQNVDVAIIAVAENLEASISATMQAKDLGDVKVKKFLNKVLQAELSPIRERRKYWEQHLDDVYDILKEGSKVAEAKAAQTLHDVRSAMQINYFDDNSLIK